MKISRAIPLLFLLLFVGFFMYGNNKNNNIYNDFNIIFDKVEDLKHNNTDSAKIAVKELYRLSNIAGKPVELESKAMFQDVFCKSAAGVSVDSIAKVITQKLSETDSTVYKFETGLLTIAMAEAKILLADYVMAINYSLRALTIFSNIGDMEYIAMSENIIGKVFITVGDHENSIRHFNKALDYYSKLGNKKRVLMVKSNICFYYLVIGRIDIVETETRKIIEEIADMNDYSMLAISYMTLGMCCNSNRTEEAYKYYRKALRLAQNIKNDNILSTLKEDMAALYLNTNKPDSAYMNYKEIEHIICKNNYKLSRLMSVYNGLANYFAYVKRFDSAYYYSQSSDSLRIVLTNNNQIANIQHSINVKYAFSEYENKLIIAKNELQLKKRYNVIIILSLIGIILVISIILFIVVYQKKIILQRENINIQKEKIKEIEIRELNERIANEEKISTLEKEKFKTEIDSKNREICSSLLLVSSKNDILKSVSGLVDNCDKGSISFPECKSKVDSIIKTNLKLDDEWNFFKLHFEKVHPNFFQKLKSEFNSLTENDLRLCAYIRIGMRTKQIAQMLALSPDSVKVNKYRLKKKLGIINDEESSLDDFVRKF